MNLRSDAMVHGEDAERAHARNQTLDKFRLLAALAIVFLHSGDHYDFNEELHFQLQLLCRFAVPFFFLVGGYFLGTSQRQIVERGSAQILRLVWVFAVACTLYAVRLLFVAGGLRELWLKVGTDLFMNGTYLHLWFLSAYITGLLIVTTTCYYGLQRWLLPASVLIVVAALVVGPYSHALVQGGFSGAHFGLFRHLLSVPFLTIGMEARRRELKPGTAVAVTCVLAGMVLQWLEVRVLVSRGSEATRAIEFLLGTAPLAVGLFLLSIRASDRPAAQPSRLADWGRRYSLGIYIIHPLLQPIALALLGGILGLAGSAAVPTAMPFAVTTFFLALLAMMAMARWTPLIQHTIEGTRPLSGINRR